QPTWRHKEAYSRIDTIWVDCHWKQSVLLETGLNLRKRSQAENRRIRRKRLEIDIESTNKKNWKEYQAKLNKELKRKLSKNSKKG
ncbi:28321_t:CDS:2, partial [Gigaspora margarita]